MPTFTLADVVYDYLTPTLEGDPEELHSWEYGKWPRVEAAVPLKAGGSVNVYGETMRWGHGRILTRWLDDKGAHALGVASIRQRPPPDRVRVGHHRIPLHTRKPTHDQVGQPGPRLPTGVAGVYGRQSSL